MVQTRLLLSKLLVEVLVLRGRVGEPLTCHLVEGELFHLVRVVVTAVVSVVLKVLE